ncbi:hypothetical protein ACEQ6A_01635 [Rhizobium brockwellii]|uniref:hypothetical protein n=1 Tax=Rhizobium brockwellii TaxID=3019932 RepID=UPI003F986079
MMVGEVANSDKEHNKKRKVCFVVGPIGAAGSASRRDADWLLKGVIEPTFKAFFSDFDVVRSDKIDTPGMIDAQMIGHLLDAEVVVADMSEHNANAFYEMGIRHMASKPIIHMFKEGTIIPFDVKPYRAIQFNFSEFDGLEAARNALKSAVEETLRPDFQVENPVTRARGVQKISEDATPETKLLWNEINALKEHILDLEGELPQRFEFVEGGLGQVMNITSESDFPEDPSRLLNELSSIAAVVQAVRPSSNELSVTFARGPTRDEMKAVEKLLSSYGASLLYQRGRRRHRPIF